MSEDNRPEFDNELTDIVRSIIREYPGYDPKHDIHVFSNDHQKSISYRTWYSLPQGTTHFDLEIQGSILYLLWIEIARPDRSQGWGKRLYCLVEKIGKELGCTEIRQTPSGWMMGPDGQMGEEKRSYFLRYGWEPCNGNEIRKYLSE